MIVQTIHEILNVFDCYVKGLGEGTVIMFISGSISSNPQYSVRLHDTGFIRTVDQNDIIMYGNPTAGQQLVPNIPEDWQPKRKLFVSNKNETL